MESSIFTLVVRAPNQQIEDVVVKCENGWTVSQLKDHLSEVYPNKPVPSKQKLIYRGQLLNNSTCLKDIFKNNDDNNGLFTIHLICNILENIKVKHTPPTPHVDIRNDVLWNVNNFQQSQEGNSADNMNPSWSRSSQVDFSQYEQLNDGQVAWVQQAYMQYLSQYMQIMASQGFNSPYMPSINLPVSDNSDNPSNNEEHQREAVQNNPDIVNNNNNNNNNAGDDIVMNRDWLDNFYLLSRVIVLFSIVYFYSSPLRFAAVTLLGFLLYLYQAGFFRTYLVFADNNNARPDNNNQILPNENPVPEGIERRPGIEGTNESTTPPVTPPNNENNVQRPGPLSFTWIFFSSFFASLIPDVPDVV